MSRLAPLSAPLFVLLWSTGFIGAKFGLPYAEPFTLLALRFGLVAGLFAFWVWATGAALPNPVQMRDAALIGLLMHGVYLGGVFWAIDLGVPAGVSALIVGLQPILTALIARHWLGERLVGMQWLGLALGFGGVALVVARKIDAGLGDWRGVALCVIGLAAISVGAILQKSRGRDHPLGGAMAVQFAAAAAFCLGCSAMLETQSLRWTPQLLGAMAWLVGVLSFGAILLLNRLIRRGGASAVASLFFLVPPVTALIAWPLFGETLGPVEGVGVAVAALGVLLVNRPARQVPPAPDPGRP